MEKRFFITPIVEGQTRMYCGPTVLALLTGKTREEIHRDINKLRRKNGKKRNKWSDRQRCWRRVPWPLTASVKGMTNSTLEKMMKKYGMKTKWFNSGYPSLRRLVDDMGHFKTPVVINVTSHYVLYFQGKIYDTHRKDGAPITEHPFAGSRVQRYWIVTKQKQHNYVDICNINP